MILSIHQPQYLPWLGYFDKVDKSETFVFLDNVQFKKNEWQNRNRIKTAAGNQWLTVPVFHKFPQRIDDVKINTTVPWGRKHLNALSTNYSKAPFYDEYMPFFQETYSREWDRLVDINIHTILFIAQAIGLSNKRFVNASEFNLQEGNTERLVDICKQLGGDVYLSGKDGAKYLDLSLFEKENIDVIFQDYTHPCYPQLFSEFEPNLSIIDLLFNCGPKSLSILRGQE
jgi:hypothetical protein